MCVPPDPWAFSHQPSCGFSGGLHHTGPFLVVLHVTFHSSPLGSHSGRISVASAALSLGCLIFVPSVILLQARTTTPSTTYSLDPEVMHYVKPRDSDSISVSCTKAWSCYMLLKCLPFPLNSVIFTGFVCVCARV